MSFKTDVFKNFAIFTKKPNSVGIFVIKSPTYKPANLLKIDSNTSGFLLILLDS